MDRKNDDLDYSDLAPQAIYLSDRDFEAFMRALENPPEPNARLVKLLNLEDVLS